MNALEKLRFENWEFKLNHWSVLKIEGPDALQFLQGQTTNDVNLVQNGQSQLNARLNNHGKVQSYFYFSKFNNEYYIFIPTDLKNSFILDLNKFIIMDDVEIISTEFNLYFIANPFLNKKLNFEGPEGIFAGIVGNFVFTTLNLLSIAEKFIELFHDLNGYPSHKSINYLNYFINESRLNELAISYKKGCFLGQETVAKIENNRGAATYPLLIELNEMINDYFGEKVEIYSNNLKIGYLTKILKLENKSIALVNLNREFRVINKEIAFNFKELSLNGQIKPLPYFTNVTAKDLSNEVYELGVKVFNQNKLDEALDLINLSITIFETTDNLEVKGVMLGRLERFEEAIILMDQLSRLDPRSVMAHTNKSLYLMRLGKISEAEEEKSIATIKSFEKFGEEAQVKKRLLEEKNKKEEELLKREKMFLQVLDIDAEDSIANYGMGDISFYRGKFNEAITFLKMAIKADNNFSTAYLLMGKSYEAISNIEEAKNNYLAGIAIATKRGEFMPANEMQARLNKL